MTGWQWHQLDHVHIICTLLQTDNHASISPLSFTGRMPFLPPNQQRQSTKLNDFKTKIKLQLGPETQICLLAFVMDALRSRCGHYTFVMFLLSFFLSFLFFSSPNLGGRRLDVYHASFYTWCGLSANLECRSEMCCTRLAENTGPKKSPKIHHLGTIAQLCRAMSSQLTHVSTIGKKSSLNSNVSPTCSHNMVNFGPLAAEICWHVWGTPTNLNGFCVLAALLHGTRVVGVSQTLRR